MAEFRRLYRHIEGLPPRVWLYSSVSSSSDFFLRFTRSGRTLYLERVVGHLFVDRSSGEPLRVDVLVLRLGSGVVECLARRVTVGAVRTIPSAYDDATSTEAEDEEKQELGVPEMRALLMLLENSQELPD